MKQQVKIACDVKDFFPLNDLKDFQGELKALSTENYNKLKKSLIQNGITMPFHVWDSGDGLYILDGHQRRRVLIQMRNEGYETEQVPIVKVLAEDWKAAKRILLSMISQYGHVARQGLYEYITQSDIPINELTELFDIPEVSMDIEKFAQEFFKEPVDEATQEEKQDEVPNVVENPIIWAGEIWQLGSHRLMCGDSTNKENVESLITEKAEFCFTSPPYADQREYNGGKELSTEHLAMFIRSAFEKVNYFAVNLGYSRKEGEINPYWDDYIKEAKGCGLKFLSWNIWDKGECGSIGNQTAMFGISHEWIFVFGPGKKDLNRTVENKSAGELANHNGNRQKDGTVKKQKDRIVGQYSQLKTVLHQTAQKARNHGIDHPAMFPVEFPEKYIEAMTNQGQSVYEPFGGSGSTLIACEKIQRKCFMMELDTRYCQVIIERYLQFTGKQDVYLLQGNEKIPYSQVKQQRELEKPQAKE